MDRRRSPGLGVFSGEGRPIEKKSQVITPTITPESELEWTFEFV